MRTLEEVREFFKNDVAIVSETPSKIPGVKTVEYRMPKLNADGTPTGEYGARVFKKTIYDPDIISDDEFIKRGLEAANDAIVGIGFDNSDTVNGLIKGGYIAATMVQNPYVMGYEGIKVAVSALRGTTPAEKILDTGVSVVTAD